MATPQPKEIKDDIPLDLADKVPIIQNNDEVMLTLLSMNKGDVSVSTRDGKIVQIFSDIISLKSPVFRKMFSHKFIENTEKKIDLSKYSHVSVYNFFKNIYGNGKLIFDPLSFDDKFQLLDLFHVYQFNTLYDSLIMYLINESKDHLVKILNFCMDYPVITEKIKNHCIDYLSKRMVEKVLTTKRMCFDSLKPGQGKRPQTDIYPYCCQHFDISENGPLSKIVAGMIPEEKKHACISITFSTDEMKGKSYTDCFTKNCCLHREKPIGEGINIYEILQNIPESIKERVLADIFT